MRISHYKKKEDIKKDYLFNEGITALEVLVLTKDSQNMGVMKTGEAILKAREMGLDLVEINPKSNPPVAKIIDFGSFRYQQEKEARLMKAHQHVIDTKCLRLSLRIGAHDVEIRRNQAVKFLDDGNKVKVEIMLRGREMQQWHLGIEIMKKFIASINLTTVTRYEQEIEKMGNKVTTIIAKA